MKRTFKAILGLAIVGILISVWLGNKAALDPLIGCVSNEELNVYCNFMNPEDLAINSVTSMKRAPESWVRF